MKPFVAPLHAAGALPCPPRRDVDWTGGARAIEAAIATDPWLAILDRTGAMRMAALAALLEPARATGRAARRFARPR